VIELVAPADADEIDLDGVVDETIGVRYLGRARRVFGDQWRCLADVCGALCVVEVTVRPTVRVDCDCGDEDDAGERRAAIDRDLARCRGSDR
jgi:hypothetical protein